MSAAAAAAQAAINQAVKASGTLIRIEAEEFSRLIRNMDDGIVVEAETGIFSTSLNTLPAIRDLPFLPNLRCKLVYHRNLKR